MGPRKQEHSRDPKKSSLLEHHHPAYRSTYEDPSSGGRDHKNESLVEVQASDLCFSVAKCS